MLPVSPSIRYRISAPAGERASGVKGNGRVCMENLRVFPSIILDGRLGSSRSSGDITARWRGRVCRSSVGSEFPATAPEYASAVGHYLFNFSKRHAAKYPGDFPSGVMLA